MHIVPTALVIHSEKIYQHHMMYRYMSDWLSRFDITVLRYRDWLSEVPEMPNDGDLTVQTGGTRHLPQDRKIQSSTEVGLTDQESTEKIIGLTPGLVVFDLDHDQMTDDIERELKLITLAEVGIQQKGGLAMVQFGEPGWFTRQFPHLIADVLHMDSFPEGSLEFNDGDMGLYTESEVLYHIEDLSLFTFRHLMGVSTSRNANRWSLTDKEPALDVFRTLFDKLREIASFENTYQIEEAAKTIERFLSYSQSYLHYLGPKEFQREYPEFNVWINNEFDDTCWYRDLSEWGLEKTIGILEALGGQSLETLLSICQGPYYADNSGEGYVGSPSLAERAVKALDRLAGRDSYRLLTGRLDHPQEESHTYWLTRSLGKWAKDKSRPYQLQVSAYLISLAEKRTYDLDILSGCVKALGEAGVGFAIDWLQSLYAKGDLDDDLRREVVLALMGLLGREARPLVIAYIQQANKGDRQVIASAAWLVDDDELFDQFLDDLTLDEAEDELIVNLIYSLVRARRSMAYQLIFHGLNSTNPYLCEGAAGFSADCMKRCPENVVNKPILIKRLKELGRSARSPLNEYATLSLIWSGIDECRSKGEDLVEGYFCQGNISMARSAIMEAGLAYSDWPSDLHASRWLNHPVAEIRHVMVYLLGYQRRTLLMESRDYLQGDISMVVPYFDNPKTLEITGRTVSEAMDIAARRITGEIPPVKVDRETYFYNQ